MPIVFQQPDPVAPQAAAAYGAAEVGMRNNAVLAGLLGDANRISLAARQGTGELQTQAMGARAHEETARGIARGNLAEEARQFDQARLDRQAAQEFAYRHEAAQAQQRTELAAWLNDRELSQREEAHLRQMENSVAAISTDGDLSPEEKQAAIRKLRTGIDVYEQRQRKAHAKMEEAHAAQFEAQAKRQTEVLLKNAELNSKTLAERSQLVLDPAVVEAVTEELGGPAANPSEVRREVMRRGGYAQWVQEGFDANGNPTWIKVEPQALKDKQKHEADLDAIRFKDWTMQVQRIQKGVEAWADRRDKKEEIAAEKAGRAPEYLTPDQIEENFQADLAKAGLAPTWEEQRARHDALKARGATTRPGAPNQAGQAGRAQPPAAAAKPFDEDQDASPDQRRQLDEFRTFSEAVEKLPIPQAAKTDYRKASRTLEGLLREHGSVSLSAIAAMPPADRKAATEARETILRVEAMPFDGGRVVSPARQAAERVPGVAGPMRDVGARQRRATDVRPWLREHVTTPVAETVGDFFTPRPVPPGGR